MTLELRCRAIPGRLDGRWLGAGQPTAFARQAPPLAPLLAVIGPPGPSGDAPAAALVAEVDVAAGMPLAINRATGRLTRADALVYPRAFVVGLAIADAAAGFVAEAKGLGVLALTDWSAVTGTPTLAAGQLYFLREGGGLTTVRPTAAGSALVAIGAASSPTTLFIRPAQPTLL